MIIPKKELVDLCRQIQETCEICIDETCERCSASQDLAEHVNVLIKNEGEYVEQSEVDESEDYCNKFDKAFQTFIISRYKKARNG